ncbi:hypothetical protein BMS3Abin10_01944 [bacterium BMS3Abin10]|nr:hypothetical protein BMS3Abin10_01944 [bacterium BMS3Abin10]GBE38201.1 hypothetical protein BMS3Bbin08_00804 [bacterium BMS3Bbin08]
MRFYSLKKLLKTPGNYLQKLKNKLKDIITRQIIENPSSGKKLIGDLAGFLSIRLSYKDRIVYSIDEKAEVVYIHRVKTHYGK